MLQKNKEECLPKKKMEKRIRAGFCSCRVFCVVCYSVFQANSVCDQKTIRQRKIRPESCPLSGAIAVYCRPI